MQQPEFIEINSALRLRTPKKSDWDLAYPWYQNPNVMYLSEGVTNKTYENWYAIGDVTLWEENLPIAIGDEEYWGQGIGKAVIKTLLKRAKSLGMTKISVPAIYHYNIGSQRLFESCGFKKVGENATEKSYEKIIK